MIKEKKSWDLEMEGYVRLSVDYPVCVDHTYCPYWDSTAQISI